MLNIFSEKSIAEYEAGLEDKYIDDPICILLEDNLLDC